MSLRIQILYAFFVLSTFSLVSARLRIVEAGEGGREGPTLNEGFEYCPSNKGYSIECIPPSETSSVVITVNGKQHEERNRPFFAAANSGSTVYPLQVYGPLNITCQGNGYFKRVVGLVSCSTPEPLAVVMNETPAPSPTPVQNEISLKDVTCVAIKGTDYIGDLSRGWVRTGGTGVTYESDNNSGSIVQSDHSVLEYKFQVPIESRYGITVDMGTMHSTEHNDIWLECTGGFTAYKNEKVRKFDGFIKVYHNRNKRYKEAKTVDYQGFKLTSTAVYRPGMQYECKVGARSTKTTVYGIILFPCDQEKGECHPNSQHYRKNVDQCNV